MSKNKFKLHFVGIGGIGMSGIAKVFANQGYQVSGSDLQDSDSTRELTDLGISVSIGHREENIGIADVIVISSAVKQDNPEVMAARRKKIPVIPRAEMLGELMRGKVGVAIAGTHGKTTTTSMVASILTEAKLDPTLVIGGKVGALGGNSKLGQGSIVVAEADESDGSFLHLPATFVAVTNIDNDHLDHFGTIENVESSFVDFVGRIPFYGQAVLCLDDKRVESILPRLTKPFLTYGLASAADFKIENITHQGSGYAFDVKFRGDSGVRVELQVPGRHNVLNATAALAISRSLGVDWKIISQGLNNFSGADRRFQTKLKTKNVWIVDDYGHHPTEIRATLEAARSICKGMIICVFQPHRYSRTQSCMKDFETCFENADQLMITDIYAAGEKPIVGISSDELVKKIKKNKNAPKYVEYVSSLREATDYIKDHVKSGDLVLTLGAGSITKYSDELVMEFK
ncbi:MAG: UDP-N-acetylmuramate--L-alanine ligase [Xanthomonadaceae bacterium]|nr:UDP-N-acetylmuramate--L-alanine ligase [Xanthomonadaceae bacterium]